MLFENFNIKFIQKNKDLKNFSADEVKNNKTLEKLVKKGQLIVGNSFEAVEVGTCITYKDS